MRWKKLIISIVKIFCRTFVLYLRKTAKFD